ncbi:MAG: hypothetical protein KZQ64_04290 [gamma proteobacterium symbiont of Bathyaustriella thionipta]|nr:hypothetical protein [gamma proteobacterium symbiont of Bathyaustriella thionipta]MCU7950646.1 hypothetical protein [gamma proteobacterium symbiont of Bathyaustriella thionipta]MCU7952598.1 hypothetical protein [gamma proteobacterium symbiont of Bathyaustriella thionipta]MCU7957765.1 hypothetical protein [gamma proteobacterium symbiont of Bathyaustriella thionipta]MCU7968550.1 hypothetical protein [gamma proteobacterium symbiont of Bathyaustriella thionipta]
MSNHNEARERREYYRIDDSAIFTYQVLDNKSSKDELKSDKKVSAAFEMIELFSQMNQQMSVALGRISENSADIASYLKGLDNKIELLAQIHLFKENESNLEQRRQINLGAGGIAFGSNTKHKQAGQSRLI